MKKYVFIILLIILSGCATVDSVKTNYDLIDYSDGVDKKEAVVIAKEHIINTKYRHRYQVMGPKVENLQDEDAWLVRFYGKKTSISEFYMPSIYEVKIDKKTGECRFEYTNNMTNIR
jgi:hypothetical protein